MRWRRPKFKKLLIVHEANNPSTTHLALQTALRQTPGRVADLVAYPPAPAPAAAIVSTWLHPHLDLSKNVDAVVCCQNDVPPFNMNLETVDALEALVRRKLWLQIGVALEAYKSLRGRTGLITLTIGSVSNDKGAFPETLVAAALTKFVGSSTREMGDNIYINAVRIPPAASVAQQVGWYIDAIERGKSGEIMNPQ